MNDIQIRLSQIAIAHLQTGNPLIDTLQKAYHLGVEMCAKQYNLTYNRVVCTKCGETFQIDDVKTVNPLCGDCVR
jgi:hypothetical protein